MAEDKIIRSCPFCGSVCTVAQLQATDGPRFIVLCMNRGCADQMRPQAFPGMAADAWNRRADNTPIELEGSDYLDAAICPDESGFMTFSLDKWKDKKPFNDEESRRYDCGIDFTINVPFMLLRQKEDKPDDVNIHFTMEYGGKELEVEFLMDTESKKCVLYLAFDHVDAAWTVVVPDKYVGMLAKVLKLSPNITKLWVQLPETKEALKV